MYKKDVEKTVSYGRNTIRNGVTYDPNGKPFAYPAVILEKQEYAEVVSEINTYFHSKYAGKTKGIYYGSKAVYRFEIHGFDNYNIYRRKEWGD